MKRLVLAAVAAVAAVAVIAAPALSRSAATTVTVTAGKPSELRFTLSKKTVPVGAVTFKVANRGATQHDFKIAGKKTRLLSAGQSAMLNVTFNRAGRYPYLCTVPGHAAGGMKGTLTVR